MKLYEFNSFNKYKRRVNMYKAIHTLQWNFYFSFLTYYLIFSYFN